MTESLKTLLNLKNILVITLLISLGCVDRKPYFNPKNIEKIRFFYLPKGLNPDHSIVNCKEIFSCPKEIISDTIIKNKKFITKFISNINSLEYTSNKRNYDFRIMCLIKDKKKKIKKLCFGTNYLIVFEGKEMKYNNEIFELIDSTLYKNVQY